jgi:O-methyltransferase involved in polyketide biosynthesis
MYYLTRTSIESTLKFISEYSGIGSMVCFDCLREGLQSVNPAEPFRFWMSLPDLKALLSDHGMTSIESIETEEMVTRYLTFNNNTQTEKCLTSFYFMLAKKN